jgi:hypothetical protein
MMDHTVSFAELPLCFGQPCVQRSRVGWSLDGVIGWSELPLPTHLHRTLPRPDLTTANLSLEFAQAST